MQQLRSAAPVLPLIFASSTDANGRPLELERRARSCEGVIELDDDGNAVRVEASSKVELCLKECPSLGYGGASSQFPKLER